MSGCDALPVLAKENKAEQPWKDLDPDAAAALMAQLAAYKAEKSAVKTGDKAVAHDVEGLLDQLNSKVSNNI